MYVTPVLRYDYEIGGREKRKAKIRNGMDKKCILCMYQVDYCIYTGFTIGMLTPIHFICMVFSIPY